MREGPGAERVAAATAGAMLLGVPAGVGVVSIAGRTLGQEIGPLWVAAAFAAAGLLLGIAAGLGRGPLRALARQLPESLDGARSRHPVSATLLALVALFGLVQAVRLACFLADPELTWGRTFPTGDHICGASYVQAADLALRGDANIYAAEHYPGFVTREPGGASPVRNLGPFIEDAYQYPPHFLIVPAAGLALSNDFLVHRTAWFVLRWIVVVSVGFAIALWLGGRRGLVAGGLVFVLAGAAWQMDLQVGQAHTVVVALSVAAMLAFARSRNSLGGALLAAAVVTKLFPGILLVYLLAQARWRPILATALWGTAYTGFALAILGPDPFLAFVEYQLPRLVSGEAFAFFDPDHSVLSHNWSVSAVPRRLEFLGVPTAASITGPALGLASLVITLGVAFVVARRAWPSRTEPMICLALLFLGSLQGALAPVAYVPPVAVWLLTLMASELRGPAQIAGALLLFPFIGGAPLPTVGGTIAVGLVGQLAAVSLALFAALRRPVAA